MIEKLRTYLALNHIQCHSIENNSNFVMFSIEDLNYLAEYNKDQDSAFFRIMLPHIVEYTHPQNINYQLITNLTSQYKCAKSIVIGTQVWLSVECFIYGNVEFPPLFARMIKVLRDMINEYRRIENGEPGEHQ